MNFSQWYFNTPKWLYSLLLLQISFFGFSQENVGISDVANTPDASSVLDIFSTSKGLLIPRMTSDERLAILNPSNALMVFDTDSSCFVFYKSIEAQWFSLCDFTQGPSGPPGDDGIHVQDAIVNAGGDLIVTLTDGTVINAGHVIGPSGTNGVDGAQGPQGETGAQGPQGDTGPQGDIGPQGPQGDVGPTGPAGADGIDGINGTNGTNGVDGAQGPQGDTGPQGPQGDEGPAGADGVDGINGTNGTNGADGAQGPQGEVGPAGPAGADGIDGINGMNGTNGADGAQGPQGETGAQGPQGDVGPAGPAGTTGQQGAPGQQGATGAQGAQGLQGLQGPQGDVGPAGADGAQGPQGETGPQGLQGETGPSWTLTTPFYKPDGTFVVTGTSGSGGPVTSTGASWLVGGNDFSTVGNAYKFGTISKDDVDFLSNNIVRGRFLNTGEMLWGNTAIIAPAIAGDPLHSYVVNNTNNWSFNGINTTPSGGTIFGANTDATNGYSSIEGSTEGTGSAIKGMHMSPAAFGIGIEGTTNNPVGAWAGIFMGDIGLTGQIFTISDVRFKKDIQPVSNMMDKIMNLEVKQYNMRSEEYPGMSFKPNKTEIGFIAQDLKEVFPGLVQQKALPDPSVPNSNRQHKEMVEGYYTVNYTSLIPILTKAIQEQQNQINELKDQLDQIVDIDISGLIPFRIIASPNARLNSQNIFIADENSKAYVVGVLNENNNGDNEIMTSGIVEIEVDNTNGQIMVGDFVTTSNLGKAIKSIDSEWVIGSAVSNELNGIVQVRIDIRFKQ